MASLHPALWHGLHHSARSRPATRPTCSCSPISSASSPTSCSRRGAAGGGDPAGRGAGVGAEHRQHPAGPRRATSRSRGTEGAARVIGVVDDQVVTEVARRRPGRQRRPDRRRRRRGPGQGRGRSSVTSRTGRIGLGLVRGFRCERGALASTVAHDAHNIVVVGMTDGDMPPRSSGSRETGRRHRRRRRRRGARRVPAPVAGLLSDAPLAEVVAQSRACNEAAGELGCTARDALPHARIPRAVGDPEAQDHRPRARRRRALRARPARGWLRCTGERERLFAVGLALSTRCLSRCGGDDESPELRPGAAASAPFRGRRLGRRGLNAVRAAVRELNSGGGIDEKVRLRLSSARRARLSACGSASAGPAVRCAAAGGIGGVVGRRAFALEPCNTGSGAGSGRVAGLRVAGGRGASARRLRGGQGYGASASSARTSRARRAGGRTARGAELGPVRSGRRRRRAGRTVRRLRSPGCASAGVDAPDARNPRFRRPGRERPHAPQLDGVVFTTFGFPEPGSEIGRARRALPRVDRSTAGRQRRRARLRRRPGARVRGPRRSVDAPGSTWRGDARARSPGGDRQDRLPGTRRAGSRGDHRARPDRRTDSELVDRVGRVTIGRARRLRRRHRRQRHQLARRSRAARARRLAGRRPGAERLPRGRDPDRGDDVPGTGTTSSAPGTRSGSGEQPMRCWAPT